MKRGIITKLFEKISHYGNERITKRNGTKKKSSFTLAEILIVVSLIAVISTLTIRPVIYHYRKVILITQLKITYEILSKAVYASIQENGPIKKWDLNSNSFDGWNQSVKAKEFSRKYIVPYLEIQYECEYRSANNKNKCFYVDEIDRRSNQNIVNNIYGITGLPLNNYTGAHVSHMFRLRNGMSVAVSKNTNNRNFKGGEVRILVDIDGPDKGKSRAGQDVFAFSIDRNNGFEPFSTYSDPRGECVFGNVGSGAQHTGGGGTTCAAYIIKNNKFRIPDDYPLNVNVNNYYICGSSCSGCKNRNDCSR